MFEKGPMSPVAHADALRPMAFSRPLVLFALVTAVAFLSRLPFLAAGYGFDSDGWLVAATARSIAYSGQYTTSRFPGFPVQELTYSLIWSGGPLAFNVVTAFMSSVAVAFFTLSLKSLGCENPILPGLALAFTPIIFIVSTGSMDYMWALAFVSGALYFVILQRPVTAGVLLGLAIGCRLTSGGMVLPFSILLYQKDNPKFSFSQILRFTLASCAVGFLMFVPIFLTYGLDIFGPISDPNPAITAILKRATTDVWGVPGLIALSTGVASIILKGRTKTTKSFVPASSGRLLVTASTWVIGLYLIAFLRHPHEGAYLNPIIPFVIILLGRFLSKRVFTGVCLAIIISPIFLSLQRGESDSRINSTFTLEFQLLNRQFVLDILRGPIMIDRACRKEDLETLATIRLRVDSTREKTVIVTGWRWGAIIRGSLLWESDPNLAKQLFSPDQPRLFAPFSIGAVEFVNAVGLNQLRNYQSKGIKAYYLPFARETNLQKQHFDLAEGGAMPFLELQKKQRLDPSYERFRAKDLILR